MAKEATSFRLKYGQSNLDLKPSDELIGVRPTRDALDVAEQAVRREIGPTGWRDAGIIGGFKIISIDDEDTDVDATLDRLRLDGAIDVGTHVFELPNSAGIFIPTGELFIEFKPGTSKEDQEAAFDEFSLTIREARNENSFVVSVSRSSPNPIKVASGLQKNKNVSIAEPDLATKRQLKSQLSAADPLLRDQWHLQNTGYHRNTSVGFVAGADARVLKAWQEGGSRGSPDIIISVIDDGFDLTHPDLALPGKTVHPWDFSRRSNDPSPNAGDWHGTACAGVALAAQGGGGVLGAAPGTTLMPVRWGPDLSDRQIEAWFGYVTNKGAAIVSCSWGALNPYFPLSTRAHRAIENCAKHGRGGLGCVIVFAAGNSNRDVNDPANWTIDGFAIHPDVIAVAASTSRDTRSDYSNFGDEISICAPSSGAGGWGILTSDVTGVDQNNGSPLGYLQGDYTYDFGGTSSACPLVAGVAGLILSVNFQLTQAEVREILESTARKIGPADAYEENGHSREFGYGCVNAADAVIEAMRKLPANADQVAKSKKKQKRSSNKKFTASW